MQRVIGVGILGALTIASVAGCRQEVDPVARVTVEPERIELPHGSTATVRLVWEMLEPLDGTDDSPTVMVHLIDEDGTLLRTFDHPFPGPWRPGETRSDEVRLYHSVLGPAEIPGTYRLTAGLYEGERRWEITAEGERVDDGEYVVATVEVPVAADTRTSPRITFTGDWLDLETGTDRQVLARRWLGEAGAIEVSRLQQPVELWLEVRIPSVEGRDQLRLVPDPGAETQTLQITSSCSDFEATLSGSGRHELAIPLATADRDRCNIQLDPNFIVVELASLRKLGVAVEQLGWEPAATEGTTRSSRRAPTERTGASPAAGAADR